MPTEFAKLTGLVNFTIYNEGFFFDPTIEGDIGGNLSNLSIMGNIMHDLNHFWYFYSGSRHDQTFCFVKLDYLLLVYTLQKSDGFDDFGNFSASIKQRAIFCEP